MTRMRRTALGVFVAMLALVLPATAGAAVQEAPRREFQHADPGVRSRRACPARRSTSSRRAARSSVSRAGGTGTSCSTSTGASRPGASRASCRGSSPGGSCSSTTRTRWASATAASSATRSTAAWGTSSPARGRSMLRQKQPDTNHNGGTLQFRGGHLYLSLGDGGGGCDDCHNAQNLSSKLGKLLRKDSNGWKVVGYGLRNPWRWSFDRKTGDIYIGDVGQSSSRRRSTSWPPRRSASRPRTTAGTTTRATSAARASA